jgi:hypothetical protein
VRILRDEMRRAVYDAGDLPPTVSPPYPVNRT